MIQSEELHLVISGYNVAYGTSGDGTPMWVAVGKTVIIMETSCTVMME